MYDNSTLDGLALSVRKTNNIDVMYSNVGDDQHITVAINKELFIQLIVKPFTHIIFCLYHRYLTCN